MTLEKKNIEIRDKLFKYAYDTEKMHGDLKNKYIDKMRTENRSDLIILSFLFHEKTVKFTSSPFVIVRRSQTLKQIV